MALGICKLAYNEDNDTFKGNILHNTGNYPYNWIINQLVDRLTRDEDKLVQHEYMLDQISVDINALLDNIDKYLDLYGFVDYTIPGSFNKIMMAINGLFDYNDCFRYESLLDFWGEKPDIKTLKELILEQLRDFKDIYKRKKPMALKNIKKKKLHEIATVLVLKDHLPKMSAKQILKVYSPSLLDSIGTSKHTYCRITASLYINFVNDIMFDILWNANPGTQKEYGDMLRKFDLRWTIKTMNCDNLDLLDASASDTIR
jgi:hypothetical protein